MIAYQDILLAVLPVFLVIGVGYTVRFAGILSPEADRSLLSLTVNVLTPSFILDQTLGNPSLRNAANVLAAPLLGFLTVAAGCALGWSAAKYAAGLPGPGRGTYAVSTGLFNYGYLPIPIVLKLFGTGTAGVLFLFNVGVELALWTFGVALLRAGAGKGLWRRALSPPAIAVLAAIALDRAGAADWLPRLARDPVHWIGSAAIPLGLLLSGATFADWIRPSHLRGGTRVMISCVLLRCGLTPVFFLAAAALLPLPVELRRILVIQGSMPAAVIPVVLSAHYGGQARVAIQVLLATTLAALLTTPLWTRAGLALIRP